MHPGRHAVRNCPQGSEFLDCNLRCKYNQFVRDDLRIDSWELRCLDCGFRETIAYRSDDSDLNLAEVDTEQCPFCQQKASSQRGINICLPANDPS